MIDTETPRGVLLMTYGSPDSLDDVGRYLTAVRGGRAPDEELLTEFRRRYEVIGGSPLIERTRDQAAALQTHLGDGWFVRPAMRFSEPSIETALRDLAALGVRDAVGIILSPQYSPLLMGGYARAVATATEVLGEAAPSVTIAGPWFAEPAFVQALAARIRDGLARLDPDDRRSVPVLVTAHSLPLRVADQEPDYLAQLAESARLVATAAGLADDQWIFCWQSAGHEPGAWMQPDFADLMPRLAAAGHDEVLIAPIQFLADHLEILYDVEIGAREQAEAAGLRFARIASFNDDPGLIRALATVARRTSRVEAGSARVIDPSQVPTDARDAILAWFAERGRPLAFRRTTDPYAILVSEAMAQQTQAARAAAYWERFMARFPTVQSLADATPADVLREWAGLGYDRRALALWNAAHVIVGMHDGRVPSTVAALQALPGVGPYTARAVAALAFGVPVGAVDVNVRRVLGRIVAGGVDIVPVPLLQVIADAAVPRDQPGAWTHAVMDVGATVCKPREPRCAVCPARLWCRYAAGERPDGEPRQTRRATGESPAPFASTNRWLRGRILDRLRAAPDGEWVALGKAIGLHDVAAVTRAAQAMAVDGVVELRPGSARDGSLRARLPLA